MSPRTRLIQNICSFTIFFVLLSLSACEKESEPEIKAEPGISPKTATLVSSLETFYHPLSADPLLWQDEELAFLDSMAGSTVIGMGEATHGTGEFFDAKFRVFRYLAEHHGYRLFAIEADMGECMFINKAIQEGQAEDMADIMKEYMGFWTWKTREVRDMLRWMNQFNQGRDETDRIRYVGIDSHDMDHNADLLCQYLKDADFPCMALADTLLLRLKLESQKDYEDYTGEYYELDLKELQGLRDSMLNYRAMLIAASEESTFLLYYHLTEVLTQATELWHRAYLGENRIEAIAYRDLCMAENVAWYSEHMGPGIFLWAHNWHISSWESSGTKTLGYNLDLIFGDNYQNIGFQFARGTFNAYGIIKGQYTYLQEQSLSVVPDELSLNWIFSLAKEDLFHVKMQDLLREPAWMEALDSGLKTIGVASAYDYILQHCYGAFSPDSYDHLIFIEETTRSSLL